MNTILKTISNIGVVPVIAIDDASKAVPLAKALVAGGLPAAEVTFRTAAAEDAMKAIAAEVPEILMGAGTVLTKEQLDRALAVGAKFIVSPGFNPELVRYGLEKGALMLPGTATGGEMEQAMTLGLEAVKFFPAEANGGLPMLKALAGPYKTLKWMPTGGVNPKNLLDYVTFDQILAVGGTWVAGSKLINEEKWDEITALCKEAVKTMLNFRLAHVGVNAENAEEAGKIANALSVVFDFPYLPGNSSVFSGTAMEVMKSGGRGAHGHIGIATSSVDRAEYHLAKKGIKFLEETRKTDAAGNTKALYLDLDIGGFAVHLVKQ